MLECFNDFHVLTMAQIHCFVREVSVNLGFIVENSDVFHGQILVKVFCESFNNLGFNLM